MYADKGCPEAEIVFETWVSILWHNQTFVCNVVPILLIRTLRSLDTCGIEVIIISNQYPVIFKTIAKNHNSFKIFHWGLSKKTNNTDHPQTVWPATKVSYCYQQCSSTPGTLCVQAQPSTVGRAGRLDPAEVKRHWFDAVMVVMERQLKWAD